MKTFNSYRTLSFRLTLWYSGSLMLLFTATLSILLFSINTVFQSRVKQDLIEDLEEFRHIYAESNVDLLQQAIQREILGESRSVFIRLLDTNAKQLFSTDLEAWQHLPTDIEAINNVANTGNPIIRTIQIEDQEFPTAIIYGLIDKNTVLHLGESTEELEEIMQILYSIFGVVILIIIPIASVISWFMAKHASRGIEHVTRTAVKIRSENLDKRVEVQSHDREIQILAYSFNAMLDRIRDLVNELREMTDNIAHDLRSPLARIRAIAEFSLSSREKPIDRESAAKDTITECDRLLQMINATLAVAEAESGISDVASQTIDVSELTQNAYDLFEPVAEEKGVRFFCNTDQNCKINGNIQYLQRMLANLIDNAIKYTSAPGTITVSLQHNPSAISLSVVDSGDGIAEADQPRVFERFFRCEKSRAHPGCGMGLSFSRAVARAHGGDISVKSCIGVGSEFTVTLPTNRGLSAEFNTMI